MQRKINPLIEMKEMVDDIKWLKSLLSKEEDRLLDEIKKCHSREHSTTIKSEPWDEAYSILREMKGRDYITMYKKIDEAIESLPKREQ